MKLLVERPTRYVDDQQKRQTPHENENLWQETPGSHRPEIGRASHHAESHHGEMTCGPEILEFGCPTVRQRTGPGDVGWSKTLWMNGCLICTSKLKRQRLTSHVMDDKTEEEL